MKVYNFNVQIPINLADLTDIELLALELIKQYLKAKQVGDVETVETKTE